VDADKLLISFLKPVVDQRSSSTPAKVATKKPMPPKVPVDLCRLKVSEPSSSCQCDVVGRNRARFGAPLAKNRGLTEVPWRHRCEPSAPPLSPAGVTQSFVFR
jgi:hypothetical protein